MNAETRPFYRHDYPVKKTHYALETKLKTIGVECISVGRCLAAPFLQTKAENYLSVAAQAKIEKS